MRQDDINEIWASNHSTPIEALLNGWKVSDYSMILTVNNEPLVMLGLVIKDILTGTGVPWLLSTCNSLKYKRYFITQVPAILDEMLNICPNLYNYVHVDNKTSIRWLKKIGFIIEKPIKYGRNNEMFHKFHFKRVDNV